MRYFVYMYLCPVRGATILAASKAYQGHNYMMESMKKIVSPRDRDWKKKEDRVATLEEADVCQDLTRFNKM